MDCPRCGQPDVDGPECPRCGVILKKARPPRPPVSRLASEPVGGPRRRPDTLSLVLLLVLAVAVFAVWRSRQPPPAVPAAAAQVVPPQPSPPTAPSRHPPRPLGLDETPPVFQRVPRDAVAPLPAYTARADQQTGERLARLLRRGLVPGPEDLQAAEDLHARYGAPGRDLIEALLLRAAEHAQAERQYAEAESLLRRAAAMAPASVFPHKALVGLLLASGDWAGAESSARAALALDAADSEVSRGLAYALLRQDRSREAIETLEDLLERHDDAGARALLGKIQQDLAAESGLVESRLAHFHVRYDGGEHARIGRAILRVLDRHYATLVRTLDHQPVTPIPVILLSRESYAAATGAPGWSGGLYDSFDGRVRIPIAGLTPNLTPDMDDTLLHELTHAFVANRSRGVAPREIHEGLAQLMEGKRVEDLLSDRALNALAQGRLQGVGGYYMASLSFVEYLLGRRGQGGLNDLLLAMAETGNADEAFEQVYGRDLQGLHQDWGARLRQQHGGRRGR